MRPPIPLLAALCAACHADPPPTAGAQWLTHPGVDLQDAGGATVELGWQPPNDACPQVYRVSVSYDVLPLQEENYDATIVVTPHPRQPRSPRVQLDRPVPRGETAPGQIFYDGFRVGKRGAKRDLFVGRTELGPASPTAACLARTWDPMEDALSLGWPKLTGRLTAIEEHWTGARVEGKCNKNACIDPETYAGGQRNHHRPCVTPDWEERLVGVLDSPTGLMAAIESSWSDGHGTAGVWSERRTIVSVDHGRPVWSRTVVHHGFPQPTHDRSFSAIQRTWVLEAIDTCPGSLREAGWARPEDVASRVDASMQRMAAFDDRGRKKSYLRSEGEDTPE